jgi:hypothetical protein
LGNLRESDHLKDIGIDVKIILKRNSRSGVGHGEV